MSDTPTDAPPTEHQEPPELRRADSLVLGEIASYAREWFPAVDDMLHFGLREGGDTIDRRGALIDRSAGSS